MLKQVLGSRAFMSIAGAVVVAAVAVAGYVIAFDPLKRTESYCAIMPDSIGLYPGNQVTMRGLTVGSVSKVRNQGKDVRVDFDVDAKYPVYADASATTVSDTVVADRNLAVLASGKNLQRWAPGTCITNTVTPKSLTETLNALGQLSEQLNGAEAGQQNSLSKGLATLDAASSGTGPQINALIHKLGSAVSSPDADIAHLAGIFDSFAAVSKKVAQYWPDIKSMMTRVGPVLDQSSDDLLLPGVELFDALRQVFPMLNEIVTMFGSTILRGLDFTVPLIKLLRANVGSLRDIIMMVPGLVAGFRTVTDQSTNAAGITYAPPRVRIPEQNAEQVCAAVNALAPGRCSGAANGLVDVDIARLVLGTAGAR
ncbi:MlaD family protein [Nocardia sp. NPDC049149]|uniref:MlaD family protein n=1 Tax=Nocardia sp. NPDC049149 TaxID=3364315 RepID=UPI0037200F6D